MDRLTHEADFGLEEWEQTLYNYSADSEGAYNILDLAEMATTDENTECQRILSDISVRLKQYEDTGLTPEEIINNKLLTGWIPVSERLPEKGREVLVTVEGYEAQGYGKLDSFTSSDVYIHGEWQRWNGVIAWMPLPKPYRPQVLKNADNDTAQSGLMSVC